MRQACWFALAVVVGGAAFTAAQDDGAVAARQTVNVFGYMTPPLRLRPTGTAASITAKCFGGMEFGEACQTCKWGSGPITDPDSITVMPESYTVDLNHPSCETKCGDFNIAPHACPEKARPEENFVQPGGSSEIPTTVKYQSQGCAKQCQQACADTPNCDAFSFRPERIQLYPFLEIKKAFCAMYNLKEDTEGSQLRCAEALTYGGNPFKPEIQWQATTLNPKLPGLTQYCVKCCDNNRLEPFFRKTVAQRCEAAQNPEQPPDRHNGMSQTQPERLNLYGWDFNFAARPTSSDTLTITKCRLNRYLGGDSMNVVPFQEHVADPDGPFLIGYNLTIGINERWAGGNWWRGVDWCYAEPIVASKAYWDENKGQLKYLELITLTNMPDPYNEYDPDAEDNARRLDEDEDGGAAQRPEESEQHGMDQSALVNRGVAVVMTATFTTAVLVFLRT